MSNSIKEMNGVTASIQKKMMTCGIRTTDALLKKGCTKKGRKEIAKACGVDEKKVLTWVNMADLCRVQGVAFQWAALMEAAGVDTVKELKTRKPENLHQKMVEVVTAKNKRSKKSVRTAPGLTRVKNFVKSAKKLKPMVTNK